MARRRRWWLAVVLAVMLGGAALAALARPSCGPPPAAFEPFDDSEAAKREQLIRGIRGQLKAHEEARKNGRELLDPETERHMRKRLAELEASSPAVRP